MKINNKINLPNSDLIYYLEVKMNNIIQTMVTSEKSIKKDLEKLIGKNFKNTNKKVQINVTGKILKELGRAFDK